MTKFPIGIQNFEKLREGGFLYVDKTAQVYSLASQGGYYFLSRSRRFGKSLLLSTFEAYFEGKKELFPKRTFLMNNANGTATSLSNSTKRLYETTLGNR